MLLHQSVLKCLNYWPYFHYINVSSVWGKISSFCCVLFCGRSFLLVVIVCAIWHSWPSLVITLPKSLRFLGILKQIIRYKAAVKYGGDSRVLICYFDSKTLCFVFTCLNYIFAVSKMLTFNISLILWFPLERTTQAFLPRKMQEYSAFTDSFIVQVTKFFL